MDKIGPHDASVSCHAHKVWRLRTLTTRFALFLSLIWAICAALVLAASSLASRPLQTAVYVPNEFARGDDLLAFQRVRASGATATRLWLHWSAVAPSTKPANFKAEDPGDPAYRWEAFDRQVRLAMRNSLQPFVTVHEAPSWAEGSGTGPPGSVRPDPGEFRRFALAAARRYSGMYLGLPRIRYWQAWNEPNIHLYLNPQIVAGRPFSPTWYRRMLNEFAAAIHSVRSDNVVIAAGLAPFRDIGVTEFNWGPLGFMRSLLCLSRKLKPTCKTRVHFDIWAHHPYTSGGPTRHAVLPDDVSLGDLPEMRQVLMAAVRAGHVVPRKAPRFWVTEFSWDTSPPDPKGVPAKLHTRWVAEGLYRMWQHGVSLVTWFKLRDQPLTNFYQSGLYYYATRVAADRPKPALQAFRFPLAAFVERGRVRIWGRTPAGRSGAVLIEQTFKGGWKRLGALRADRYGIFQARFRGSPTGWVRATIVSTRERAVPFSLRRVPDRFFNPFGLPFPLEPKKTKR